MVVKARADDRSVTRADQLVKRLFRPLQSPKKDITAFVWRRKVRMNIQAKYQGVDHDNLNTL